MDSKNDGKRAHIKWLFTPGEGGALHSPEEWRGEIRRAGYRCGHCHGLIPEMLDGLPADYNEMLAVVRQKGWTK